MWAIKSIRIIDFLWENGLQPLYEKGGLAYYKTSDNLRDLLDRYTIIYECIPNRGY